MDGTLLFYYTLFVLLISIMAAAACVSVFLVSRKKPVGYAAMGFLVYFFDVAIVFEHSYATHNLIVDPLNVFAISSPYLSILTGAGILGSFWLMICEYFRKEQTSIRVAPIIGFVIASLIAYHAIPVGSTHQFVFYSMREVFLAAALIYIAVHYISEKNELEQHRIARHWKLYIWVWIGCIAIVIENVVFQIILKTSVEQGIMPFLPDRNFAENILVIGGACIVFVMARRLLTLYYKNPPTHTEEPVLDYISSNLSSYCDRYELSARESEVLELVLQGLDNQHIASTLNLALSTVKVHVHNILKKTGLANRQDVIHDFWKTV